MMAEHDPLQSDFFAIPPASRPRRGTLRQRVIVVVLGLSLIPATLALFFAFFSAFFSIQTNARQAGLGSAETLAQELDTRLQVSTESFRTFLRNSLVRDQLGRLTATGETGALNGSEQRQLLSASDLSEEPVFFITDSGQPYASLFGSLLEPLDTLPKDLNPEVVLNIVREMPEEGVFLVECESPVGAGTAWLIGPVLREPDLSRRYLAAVRVPVGRIFSGIERLALAERRSVALVSLRMGTLQGGEQLPSLDRFLTVEGPQLIRNRSGYRKVPDYDSLEYAYCQSRVATSLSTHPVVGVRWAMIHKIDLDEAIAPLNLALWSISVMGLILVTGIAVFGVWAANRLVRPILTLSQGVERLASGELDYRVEITTGDEIEELANSMNRMAETLALSYKRLADKLLELDEKARQLALVHRISRTINRSLELEEVFHLFTTELRELIYVERISLALLNDAGTAVEYAHVFPENREELPRGTIIPLMTSAIGEALRTGEVLVRVVGDEPLFAEEELLLSSGVKSLCILPLMTKAGPLGALGLSDRDEDRFGPGEVELLQHLSENLTLAVEHSRLFSRVSNFAAELEAKVDQRTRDLRAAQTKLVQSEKFAAAGKIATDLAHEINNPLSIIKNYLTIVSSQMMQPASKDALEQTRSNLHIIEEEIDRIARIVAQLRQLNSPHRPTLKNTNINSEIRSLSELFKATFAKRRIALEVELDDGIPDSLLCTDYFRQVLINLLNNSADAMENGGEIKVSSVRSQERPGFANVAVRDDGCGIPEENLLSIFDPFFTTKKEGKGTGLGLSVSYGLAQQMGGTLTCESKVGVGTTMILTIALKPKDDPTDDDRLQPDRVLNTDFSIPGVRREGGRIILG